MTVSREERCSCDWATGECQGPLGCQAVAAALRSQGGSIANDDLMEALYAAKAAVRPLIRTEWKDSIDIDVPSYVAQRLAEEILKRATRSPPGSMLPRELTAENGAKAALIGEFFEVFEYVDEEGDECEAHVQVSWSTIKAIWKAAVAHFDRTAALSREVLRPPGTNPDPTMPPEGRSDASPSTSLNPASGDRT